MWGQKRTVKKREEDTEANCEGFEFVVHAGKERPYL